MSSRFFCMMFQSFSAQWCYLGNWEISLACFFGIKLIEKNSKALSKDSFLGTPLVTFRSDSFPFGKTHCYLCHLHIWFISYLFHLNWYGTVSKVHVNFLHFLYLEKFAVLSKKDIKWVWHNLPLVNLCDIFFDDNLFSSLSLNFSRIIIHSSMLTFDQIRRPGIFLIVFFFSPCKCRHYVCFIPLWSL